MPQKEHWERVYSTKDAAEVSWFQKQALVSLRLIRDINPPQFSPIIDVGGGASTLVDGLLANGYENVTVLDLSDAALNTAKARLEAAATRVDWIAANVLEAQLPADSFNIWHDRAVFHFLTTEDERQGYVRQVRNAVKPGGRVIMATFAEDGPEKCSGLPVVRYNAEALQAEFGDAFELIHQEKETHVTPGGNEQRFIYCVFANTSG